MIKYYLIENPIIKGDNRFMALVSNVESKNLNDIINLMIDEGTGLTRPQALAYFERLMQAIGFWLQNGYAVNTPLVKFRASITGTFRDEFDNFDPSRHQLNIRAVAGARMKNLTTTTKLERSLVASQAPLLISFNDTHSNEDNATATVGGIGILRGNMLSFDKTDPLQGVFLKPVNETDTVVKAEFYSLIKPQEVHFLIPEAAAGEYVIEIRSLSKNGKEWLKGELKSTLTIA